MLNTHLESLNFGKSVQEDFEKKWRAGSFSLRVNVLYSFFFFFKWGQKLNVTFNLRSVFIA